MHNLMPPGTKIAVLINPANVPNPHPKGTSYRVQRALSTAPILNLNASRPSELELAFETLSAKR